MLSQTLHLLVILFLQVIMLLFIRASSAAKLGVGRTATTYNLEVEGSIFATGSSLILGDTGSSKAIIQKRTVGLGLHFADESGVDQNVLDGNGNFGIGKNPSYRLDVSGNSWVDGDITTLIQLTPLQK